MLDTDQSFSFDVSDNSSSPTGSCSYCYAVSFTSELHERLYQRWKIKFIREHPFVDIQEITKGPSLLKEDFKEDFADRWAAINQIDIKLGGESLLHTNDP